MKKIRDDISKSWVFQSGWSYMPQALCGGMAGIQLQVFRPMRSGETTDVLWDDDGDV